MQYMALESGYQMNNQAYKNESWRCNSAFCFGFFWLKVRIGGKSKLRHKRTLFLPTSFSYFVFLIHFAVCPNSLPFLPSSLFFLSYLL